MMGVVGLLGFVEFVGFFESDGLRANRQNNLGQNDGETRE